MTLNALLQSGLLDEEEVITIRNANTRSCKPADAAPLFHNIVGCLPSEFQYSALNTARVENISFTEAGSIVVSVSSPEVLIPDSYYRLLRYLLTTDSCIDVDMDDFMRHAGPADALTLMYIDSESYAMSDMAEEEKAVWKELAKHHRCFAVKVNAEFPTLYIEDERGNRIYDDYFSASKLRYTLLAMAHSIRDWAEDIIRTMYAD